MISTHSGSSVSVPTSIFSSSHAPPLTVTSIPPATLSVGMSTQERTSSTPGSTSTSPGSTLSRITSLAASSTTAAVPIKCQNGGTPVGDHCLCPPFFTGHLCQEAMNEVQVANITATIIVFVKVENQTFTPEMAIPGSKAFQDFVKNFVIQMRKFYEDIPGFQNISVIRLSEGSINVDHEVLVSMPFSNFNKTYDSAVEAINRTLLSASCSCASCSDASSQNAGCLAFNPIFSRVLEVPLSAEALCKNQPGLSPDLQQYYVGRNISGTLYCVSNCSYLHPHPFSCMNGNCYLQPDGPSCYCAQSDSYWYSGQHCEQSISKVGVAVGVALGLAALLLLILLLAVLLCWRRCRPKDRPTNWAADEEKWYENEAEWGGCAQQPCSPHPSACQQHSRPRWQHQQ
ncbi:mucin-3A [Pogona vitticeps]